MKLLSIVSIGLLVTAASHPVFAENGKTRAQVRAELDEAMQAGNMLTPGEIGLPLHELRPDLYPRAAIADGTTREQVKLELSEALRTGETLAAGESSLRMNEVYPNLYPAVTKPSGKTRAEVKEELADALRTGDILAGGEQSLKLNELFPSRYKEQREAIAGRCSPASSLLQVGPCATPN